MRGLANQGTLGGGVGIVLTPTAPAPWTELWRVAHPDRDSGPVRGLRL